MKQPSWGCTSIEWLRWVLHECRRPHALLSDDEIAEIAGEFGLL